MIHGPGYAGTAMNLRATYQDGATLEPDPAFVIITP
jgi:hypothetical protein